jgi:hypothetical protein
VGESPPAEQVEFDAAQGCLGWRRVDAVGAEIGDVSGAGDLDLVEECRYLVGEVRPHDRSEEIDPLNATKRGCAGLRVVPVEMRIGSGAGRGANR